MGVRQYIEVLAESFACAAWLDARTGKIYSVTGTHESWMKENWEMVFGRPYDPNHDRVLGTPFSIGFLRVIYETVSLSVEGNHKWVVAAVPMLRKMARGYRRIAIDIFDTGDWVCFDTTPTGLADMAAWSQQLTEMALPSEKVQSIKYYHGTSSTISGKNIIKNGIQPPTLVLDNGKKRNNYQTPVEGKVYVTPSLAYAICYTIGGNIAGHASERVPYKGNEDRFKREISDDPTSRYNGRYGYVFVIDGSKLQDIQPDEDSIGEFIGQILSKGSLIKYMDAHDAMTMQAALDDDYLKLHVLGLAQTYLAPSTLKRIKDGEAIYQSKAGKVIVKRMSDWAKVRMVEYGFHCAHTGPLVPDEVWRIDKAKRGWLNKDGSNFFDIAKRVR